MAEEVRHVHEWRAQVSITLKQLKDRVTWEVGCSGTDVDSVPSQIEEAQALESQLRGCE